MRECWVGNAYGEKRLLLLGESAYSWTEDGEEVPPPPDHEKNLVKRVCAGETVSRFMTTVTQGLVGTDNPSPDQIAAAWDKVAFANYVPGTVGIGPRNRPSQEHWKEADAAFPDLLAQLKPRNVIVLGKDMWGRMREADVWLTDDVQGYTQKDGEVTICWAVDHPSRGRLSGKRLWQLIAFVNDRKIIP